MRFNVDDLIAKGLVHKKTYKDGPYSGLSVLKYKNNVFWDNLWHTDSRLLECRGMVVDSDDNVIIWPFTKIFNRFENGTDINRNQAVTVTRKVNGFLAAATTHNEELLVSTTGTLDSDFVALAKKYIKIEDVKLSEFTENWTLIFEICDASDPHIVEEEQGAYLIGCRCIQTGKMLEEYKLDLIAFRCNWNRPEWHNMIFSDVVKTSKECQHEGFVVRDFDTGELLLKIKSPHYLAKKFLMRGNQKKWDMLWDDPKSAKKRVEEEFYGLLDWIRFAFTKEEWSLTKEQDRRKIIETYFERKS